MKFVGFIINLYVKVSKRVGLSVSFRVCVVRGEVERNKKFIKGGL